VQSVIGCAEGEGGNEHERYYMLRGLCILQLEKAQMHKGYGRGKANRPILCGLPFANRNQCARLGER